MNGRNYQGGRGPQQNNRVVQGIVANVSKLDSLADLPVDDLVKYAEDMGKHLNQIRLKTSQIRKFLDTVRKLESESGIRGFQRDEVKLLKPKLAYAAGRQPREVKPLMELLGPCIDRVDSKNDFKTFVRLVESIVAYHKFYGGRD